MTAGRAVLENLRLHGILPKLADGKLKLVGRQNQITSAIVAAGAAFMKMEAVQCVPGRSFEWPEHPRVQVTGESAHAR
jgi:hypothetical protein